MKIYFCVDGVEIMDFNINDSCKIQFSGVVFFIIEELVWLERPPSLHSEHML